MKESEREATDEDGRHGECPTRAQRDERWRVRKTGESEWKAQKKEAPPAYEEDDEREDWTEQAFGGRPVDVVTRYGQSGSRVTTVRVLGVPVVKKTVETSSGQSWRDGERSSGRREEEGGW
jgi:hypothetical protein